MSDTDKLNVDPARAGANQRLRDEIDSGKTGDKVGVVDPAMAPLGTDDEAGAMHDEEGLRVAREASKRPPPARNPDQD